MATSVLLDAEAAARASADAALQAALDAERAARIAADELLQTCCSDETAIREGADAALRSSRDAEILDRVSGDALLQLSLAAEALARAALGASKVAKAGDTMTGDLNLPNLYTSGKLSAGASMESPSASATWETRS